MAHLGQDEEIIDCALTSFTHVRDREESGRHSNAQLELDGFSIRTRDDRAQPSVKHRGGSWMVVAHARMLPSGRCPFPETGEASQERGAPFDLDALQHGG
jgi:hypothetical protein